MTVWKCSAVQVQRIHPCSAPPRSNSAGSRHRIKAVAMNGSAAHTDGGYAATAVNGVTSTSLFNGRVPVHVEARLQPSFNVVLADLRSQIKAFVLETHQGADRPLRCECALEGWQAVPGLAKHVERIQICEASNGQSLVPLEVADIVVHAFYAASQDDVEELMAGDAEGEDRGQDDAMAATVLELPNAGLEGVWENLIYADDVKARLLNYMYTTLLYSDASVDLNIIAWNRLLLLHGPPGTGKTSLCRALAQKLSVRLSDRYAYGKLIEINSHSLFSKWFSESGKLVQRLFSMVMEMVADPEALIVVLIDEVESLTAARTASAASGAEPSDAVRVVNALLTQLDKLKRCKNVLVVTTSNLSESIDNAFIDRADIKQFIGPPPPQAIYWIMRSCLQELMRVGLVAPEELLPWVEALQAGSSPSFALAQLAQQAEGLSGRTLRRLPVMAHARYIGMAAGSVPSAAWLQAMQRALLDARSELNDTDIGSRKQRSLG